jgi:hypothetical protein
MHAHIICSSILLLFYVYVCNMIYCINLLTHLTPSIFSLNMRSYIHTELRHGSDSTVLPLSFLTPKSVPQAQSGIIAPILLADNLGNMKATTEEAIPSNSIEHPHTLKIDRSALVG